MKPMILVTAPVATRSGYGNHARDICRALIESDKYDVKIQSVRWGNTPPNALEKDNPHHDEIQKRILREPKLDKQPDIHMHIVVPNEFASVGKKNIGVTAGIEHSVPPASWIEGVNRMDMTIFTSEYSKKSFDEVEFTKFDNNTQKAIGSLKVEKPSDVLFEGADTNVYKQTKEISNDLKKQFETIKEDFCFLFVGHWLQGNLGEDRKDVGMLIKTFLMMFKGKKEKPALILKTSSSGFSIMDRNELKRKINQIKKSLNLDDFPNIYILHGDLSDEEMNQLYNHPKVKTHITFTHGEGFGRPLLEASLSGKPIIAPVSTGQADFLEKEYVVEIPHTMAKVPESSFPKEYMNPEAVWSVVNYNMAARLMVDVFENYDKYKLRGKKQMIVNKERFNHEEMSKKLLTMVEKILEDVPQQVQLKLPDLKKEPKKLKLPKLKKA